LAWFSLLPIFWLMKYTKNTVQYKILYSMKREFTEKSKPSSGAIRPAGKRARTRAALVEAAAELIAEEGYDQLSMERVAARAGMTKGAIYNNFASKEDLIIEAFTVGVRRSPPPLIQGGSLAEQLEILAEDLIAQAPHARAVATKLVAFQLYALTHKEMRQRVAKERAELYREMEAWARRFFPAAELPMSPAQFVRMLHALSNGLLVTHALAPNTVSADVVRATFRVLAGDKAKSPRPKQR
jgi:AcrR family transcriptional regulator